MNTTAPDITILSNQKINESLTNTSTSINYGSKGKNVDDPGVNTLTLAPEGMHQGKTAQNNNQGYAPMFETNEF